MRLFHVSEEPDIKEFVPRIPYRTDLDPSTGLVWALNERTLPNFLTPRDCPRVTFHVAETTTKEDQERFLSSSASRHCVAIEQRWLPILLATTLTIYEFDPANFVLQDDIAGFYVSTKTEYPIAVHTVDDILAELRARNIELRVLPELFTLRDRIVNTTFYWSMCRMKHALPHDLGHASPSFG